jgi:hypothetical protein
VGAALTAGRGGYGVIVFGRRKLPGSLRPKLDSGERLLAWARTADDPGQAVVVTTFGLWLPGRPRLGWHEIHKATWAGSRLTVIPAVPVGEPVPMDGAGSYAVMSDGEPVSVALAEPGDVPPEVRTRVTRSVAFTAHHPLSLGGVRVVARRVPGVNGLVWHVRYDEGTPVDDPEMTAVTTEMVRQAASSATGD